MKRLKIFLIAGLVIWGCSGNYTQTEQSVFQVSTIDAVLQGVYDGNHTLKEVGGKGDFGIGTFNNLDGEMILVDGHFYQVKSDGKVYKPDLESMTPFATVTNFEQENQYQINGLNFEQFEYFVDSLLPTPNLFYAIRVKADFQKIHVRSVPAQHKPYPPLVEVAKNQPEFFYENIHGELIGFYSPEFVKGVNVTGFHLHFLSDDKLVGGHVLDFQLNKGLLIIDKILKFEMILPNEGDFLTGDFSVDRSFELEEAEK